VIEYRNFSQIHASYENVTMSYLDATIKDDQALVFGFRDYRVNPSGNILMCKQTQTGVDTEHPEQNQIEVTYTNNILRIITHQEIVTSVNLAITNIQGQVLFNFISQNFQNNIIQLPVPLVNGTYFCTITTPTNSYSQQFNVVR
jgi:cobalamin biosynthesis Co2+ chelatase CbiK